MTDNSDAINNWAVVVAALSTALLAAASNKKYCVLKSDSVIGNPLSASP